MTPKKSAGIFRPAQTISGPLNLRQNIIAALNLVSQHNQLKFLSIMVEGGGFEPPKVEPADLQSAPFDRSGTPPKIKPRILLERSATVNRNRLIQQIFFYTAMLNTVTAPQASTP